MLNMTKDQIEVIKDLYLSNDEIEEFLSVSEMSVEVFVSNVANGEVRIERNSKEMMKWINDDSTSLSNFYKELLDTPVNEYVQYDGKTFAEAFIDMDERCVTLSTGKVVFIYQ